MCLLLSACIAPLKGANLWHGMHLGAAGTPGSDRSRLTRDLDALARAGVTHVRILGASEGPDTEPWRVTPSLQPCPGVYNAKVRGSSLDATLNSCITVVMRSRSMLFSLRRARAQVLDGFDFLVYQLGKRRLRATGAQAASLGRHAIAQADTRAAFSQLCWATFGRGAAGTRRCAHAWRIAAACAIADAREAASCWRSMCDGRSA
jgi:hypothetical protein